IDHRIPRDGEPRHGRRSALQLRGLTALTRADDVAPSDPSGGATCVSGRQCGDMRSRFGTCRLSTGGGAQYAFRGEVSMVRAFGMMVFAGIRLGVSSANAQSLGEAAAATGIQNSLAGTSMGNPAGTIGTVKRALGAAAATKQGQLDGAAKAPIMGAVGWGGKGGGKSGWTASAGGWKGGGGAGKAWTAAAAGRGRGGWWRQGRRRRVGAGRRLGHHTARGELARLASAARPR